jgi:hypothetical protein
MSDLNFTYEGKACGFIRKGISKVVSVEEEWITTCEKGLAGVHYTTFLKPIKEEVLRLHAIEITDSQAWMIARQVLDMPVPDYLRDDEHDEETDRKGVIKKGLAGIAGVLDASVNVATAPVRAASSVLKGSSKEE